MSQESVDVNVDEKEQLRQQVNELQERYKKLEAENEEIRDDRDQLLREKWTEHEMHEGEIQQLKRAFQGSLENSELWNQIQRLKEKGEVSDEDLDELEEKYGESIDSEMVEGVKRELQNGRDSRAWNRQLDRQETGHFDDLTRHPRPGPQENRANQSSGRQEMGEDPNVGARRRRPSSEQSRKKQSSGRQEMDEDPEVGTRRRLPGSQQSRKSQSSGRQEMDEDPEVGTRRRRPGSQQSRKSQSTSWRKLILAFACRSVGCIVGGAVGVLLDEIFGTPAGVASRGVNGAVVGYVTGVQVQGRILDGSDVISAVVEAIIQMLDGLAGCSSQSTGLAHSVTQD